MKNISTVDARNNFSDVVNRAAYGKERVILTRRGKKIAAVIPIEDVEALNALEDAIDKKDADAAYKEAKKKGWISLDDLKKELEL